MRWLLLPLIPLAAVLSLVYGMMQIAQGATEADYSEPWCESMGGESEVTMIDGSRADCLTENLAVEVDFAYKWAESIGQALLYSKLTGKQAAVMLIVRPNEGRFLVRFHNAADGLNIRLFLVDF